MAARTRYAVLAVAVLVTGCATDHERGGPAPVSTTWAAGPSATADPAPQSLAAAIRVWEAGTGDLFKRSARALQQVSEASDAGDEAAVRAGCTQLHDTNAVQLQRLLPTPDPELTAELQRMIDDMNVATHACLRFVIARQDGDSATYQQYLARAVDHLQQAKIILDSDLRRG